jgi:hypothetical protein
MPLPNAKPDPAGSNVYRQLNSIKLGDLTNEQFNILYDNVFLNDISEDELRRLALIGAARQSMSASSSGPIPLTAKFVTATVTDTNKATLFRPNPGEVWALQAIGAVVTGGSGTRTFAAYNYDGTNELNWLSVSSSGSNLTFTGEGEYPDAPFYCDYNVYWRIQSTGTFDSIQYNLSVIRVR